MNIIFLINGVISFAIALLLGINFFKDFKNKRSHEVVTRLSFIGLLYFFLSIFSLLWAFDVLTYNSADFLFMYSLIILVQSIMLFMIVHLVSKNKRIFYFLFFYLIIFLSFFSSIFSLLYLFIITSFLLSLLFFLNLSFRRDVYVKVGYMGMIYSFFSLVLYFLLLFRIGEVFVFSLFSNLFFLILSVIFLRDIKIYPKSMKRIYGGVSSFLIFLRYFVFLIVLTNFVFIATMVIHEFGHLTVARFYGCTYSRIVYESDLHTEFLCSILPSNPIVVLGGVLSPFLIAGFLFFLGGQFLREISLLMIGFNLICSNKDILELGFSGNIVAISLIVGVIFLLAGMFMLVKSRLKENDYF